jgi:hypothetical protein
MKPRGRCRRSLRRNEGPPGITGVRRSSLSRLHAVIGPDRFHWIPKPTAPRVLADRRTPASTLEPGLTTWRCRHLQAQPHADGAGPRSPLPPRHRGWGLRRWAVQKKRRPAHLSAGPFPLSPFHLTLHSCEAGTYRRGSRCCTICPERDCKLQPPGCRPCAEKTIPYTAARTLCKPQFVDRWRASISE